MTRTWTIIGVRDVPRSFTWYQSLLGRPETQPVHSYFGQILDADGTVLLCLHQWGAHEHPSLMSPDQATPGNGLLLFFRVDDFDASLKRARALVDRFDEEPHVNPNTRTEEFSLRDPDGYYVTISALAPRERVDTSMPYDLEGTVFRSVSNTGNGEVGADTLFHYRQSGAIVTATYSGGSIVSGHLIATVLPSGQLDMRYHHVNSNGELMLGKCLSTPERLPDGRLRFHEQWQWLTGDMSSGNSVVEEIEPRALRPATS